MSDQKSPNEILRDKLYRKQTSSWSDQYMDKGEEIFALAEDYKQFLKKSKTERLCVKAIEETLLNNHFKQINKTKKIRPGDKLYKLFRNKSILAFIAGKSPQYLRIIGSHVDSPHLDLKPNPLYEDTDLALFQSHYYGGIKKYQWQNIPFALHGIIITGNNKKINISLGEKPNEPKFIIPDLLHHLSKEKMKEPTEKVVQGEDLNIIIGHIPVDDKNIKQKVKFALLQYLNKKYGIIEEDFCTAELQFVPAAEPVDIGFDRGLIAGYGQDDRICVYTSLRSLLETSEPGNTAMLFFADKEETGSLGDTGAAGLLLSNFTDEYLEKSEIKTSLPIVLENTLSISADVTPGWNPNFKEVQEKNNVSILGRGVSIQKYYDGSHGKNNTHETHAEYMAYIKNIAVQNNIPWQTGEIGKIDLAQSGTISKFMSKFGMNCIDAGPPLLGMHSPMEIASKADLFAAYELFKNFFRDNSRLAF